MTNPIYQMKKAVTDTASDLLSQNETLQDPQAQGEKAIAEVEQVPAHIAPGVWMGLAVGSMFLSAGLEIFTQKKHYGQWVGLWAPCFLMVGLYSKVMEASASRGMRNS